MSRSKFKLPAFRLRLPSIERLLMFVLATLNVVGQGALLFAYSRDWLPYWGFLAIFLGVTLVLLGLAFLLRRRGEASAYLVQMALWSLVTGPFGATVVWFLGLVSWSRRTVQADFGKWLDSEIITVDQERIDRIRNDLLDHRLRIEGASDAESLADVIADGDQKGKFDALNVIARYFEPSLTPALRLAGYDSDPSVRVLASTVMAKLQTQFSDKHNVMKKLAGVNDVQAWRLLARAHLDYAASGLLEPLQARDERIKARGHYEYAISLAPLDDGLRLEFSELLIVLGEIDRALAQLEGPWSDADAREKAALLRSQLVGVEKAVAVS